MAKLNIEINVTGEQDVKKLEKALKNLEASSSSVAKKNTQSATSFKSMAIKIALATAAIYTLNRAISLATSDGFAYNNSLEQSTQGLIALSVAAQDKAIPVMDRYANATREATYTMAELQKINAETPHTLDQTNQIYKAMYISMRNVGATTDQMINLTKKLSIAAGAAGIEFNSLLAGVDGLATGTVLANSDLGRFLSGLGLTNTKLKETKDVVGLVTSALEDFEAADTMAVAVSNATNSWNIFAGTITKPIFDGVKNALNQVSKMMNEYGPKSTQVFADALVDFANAGIKAIGFVIKAVNQLIGVLQISYSGYQQLYGMIKGGDIAEAKKELEELQRIKKEGDYGLFSNQSIGVVRANIKAKEKEIELMKEANKVRAAGEKLQQDAVKRTEEINKLVNTGIEKMHINYGKVSEAVKTVEKPLESVFKSAKDTTKETDKTSKALEKAAKKANDLKRKFYEITGQSEKLFMMDVDEVMGEFIKSGKYSAEELSDIYDGMWDEYQARGEEANESIVESLSNAVSGMAQAYQAGGMAALGEQIGNMLVDGANALIPGLGTAFEVIGALFSDNVSQQEIEASIGRVEFSDQSLANLLSVFEEAQNPMLDVTNKMHRHIRSMDGNFYQVAKALTSGTASGGIDLTGANFVDTFSTGFLGFSSKSVQLIGTGLKFQLQTLSDVMNEAELSVQSYTTTLVKKSSWFGLKKSSKIQETYKDLPKEVIADLAANFALGYETIMTAGVSLGMNEVNLDAILQKANISLGKIDFTGLSTEEVQQRLSDAYSTAFSKVIDKIPQLQELVDRYTKGLEGSMETLGRIAVEYDQGQNLFSLIGKDFTDGLMDVTRTWTETTIVEQENVWGSWFGRMTNIIGQTSAPLFKGFSLFGRRWGQSVKTITTTFTETTQELYTAQMQILDIIESAGGLTSFQDAMASYMGNFFTEAEQTGFLIQNMANSFATLGQTMPATNDEFRYMMETIDTSTEDGAYLYGQLLLLAEGFNQMTEATDRLSKANEEALNATRQALKGYSNAVADLLLGSYSNLGIAAKQKFAEGYKQMAADSEGLLSSVDAARAEMELAFRYATTQEEYGVYVDRLVTELKKEVPEATNDDIVGRLDILINATREYNETLKMTAGVR